MGALPTIRDIARELGVDSSTVSLALRDHPRIARATRERIQRAAREMGYVPNRAAQALRRGRSRTIAFVLWGDSPEPVRQAFADYTLAATAAAFQQGYQLLLLQAGQERLAAATIDRFPELHQADGALFVGETLDRSGLAALVRAGYPLVHLGERRLEGVELPLVSADFAQGGVLAAAHLLARGHRRLVALCEPHPFAPEIPVRRLAGFREAAGPALLAAWDVERGADLAPVLERILGLGCTGVFTTEHGLALRLLAACHAQGVRVPETLSVVAFDDLPSATMSVPPLTCVRQPRAAAGRLAVDLLQRLIEGRAGEPRQFLLPCELVERGSVGRGKEEAP